MGIHILKHFMVWDINGNEWSDNRMEIILLAISLLLFLAAIGTAVYVRISLIRYTTLILDCMDCMSKQDFGFLKDLETLPAKIQMKMYQLYEFIEKKSEENLRQKKQLESTISDISHQVKTPLANIRMYHNLLERDPLESEKQKQFLQAAEHQVDKLEFFIKSMIKMSRLETGVVCVQPETNSVYELIAQAVCDIALKAEEKDIEITADCREDLLAYFDRRWTLESVFNILDNSVKYTRNGGRIEISAGKTDFFVRIKIKDNGRGIVESHIPDIFKRFYREPESAQTEGIGIGLYLAREIVMKQRGFIEVRSKAGIGTEMYINLPISG